MTNLLHLPKCHYFGPYFPGDEPERVTMPDDLGGDPFAFLPATYELSDEERELAAKYEQGDFSGGYITSQIAHFRRPLSKERHEARRARLKTLQAIVQATELQLPENFVKLVESDEVNDRLRHNTIWLQPPEELVPFPEDPEHQLAQVFYEGQGCGNWHLLLSPGPSHRVVYTDDPLGLPGEYPDGFQPDLTKYKFYECAASFDEWLIYYFLDCTAEDRHYDEMLEKYPGM